MQCFSVILSSLISLAQEAPWKRLINCSDRAQVEVISGKANTLTEQYTFFKQYEPHHVQTWLKIVVIIVPQVGWANPWYDTDYNIICNLLPSLERGPGILLAESRKSTKKVPENRKNTENVAGNRKIPFWSYGKMKKILQKARKGIFFCRKLETDPLFPAL